MKVLERSSFIALPEYPKKHTCKKCKSKLEYDKKDVGDNTDPRDQIPDFWITCPVCKSQETVKL